MFCLRRRSAKKIQLGGRICLAAEDRGMARVSHEIRQVITGGQVACKRRRDIKSDQHRAGLEMRFDVNA